MRASTTPPDRSTAGGPPARAATATLDPERRLAVQYAIARAFAEGERLSDVSRLLLETISHELGWDAAGLWTLADDGSSLRLTDGVPRSGRLAPWTEASAAMRFRIGQGVPGAVWQAAHPIWVRDTDNLVDFPRRGIARSVGIRHGFAFPIVVRDAVVAVIELFAARVQGLDAEQAEFLTAVGHQLGSFIERTDSRRAVADSEARKTAILQAALDAIISSDADGRILEFNTAAERLFGCPRDEAVGRTIAELIVPADLRGAHRAGLARYLATAEPRILGRRVRTRGLTSDGREVPIELTVTEAHRDGHPIFTAFIRDISREVEAETARDRFLEILSHELRTPITSIYGGAKLLARSSIDQDTRTELLHDIGDSADRLHRLVENLIVLARAQQGADNVTLEPVNLDRVVARSVTTAQASRPDLAFRLASTGARQAVQGEETAIEQILSNLLSNAGKYGAAGRVVEVFVEHGSAESLVRVLDRGPGLSATEAARLFEIDYRSPLTDGLAKGSGIGLFVARWLAQAMGGRVWARPRPGGGSEFGFGLRALDPDSSEPPPSVLDVNDTAPA